MAIPGIGNILNIADVTLQTATPEQMPPAPLAANYDLRWGEIARRIGARKLGYNLTVIAPGKLACPFHNHRSQEEMFFILEGSGELRLGNERHPIRSGDIIACPPGGRETAHQIINTGDVEMRFLAVSSNGETDICEYPDSGKYQVIEPAQDETQRSFRIVGRYDSTVDYWEGE
jgi:uncharacterized cupin superfamily protein